jgi:hypothetical protein
MAVVRLEVTTREPYEGGQSFGATGSYEKVAGACTLPSIRFTLRIP